MRKLIALVAVLALVAAGCGGGSDADGVASLESDTEVLAADPNAATEVVTTEVDDEEAMLAFTQCLRDQGLDIADPEVDDEGNLRLARPGQDADFDREAFQAAREACAQFLEGVSFGFREFDRTEIEDTLVEFAACMRDNGVDMPDPDFSATPGAGGGGGRPFGDIDPTDPAFEAASEVCQEILSNAFGEDGPGRGPGGGGPAGGGPGGGGDA